jgi:hypothetical protein
VGIHGKLITASVLRSYLLLLAHKSSHCVF